ncbi:MAG: hypothetical protein KF751_01045 [Nitrospira sp.]|nr:hypothetical protein [Nitrospira sp.]MBX3351017.1 hypothetical protein [Nitrospira sp.]
MLTLLIFLAAYTIIILLTLSVPLAPQVQGGLGSVCASLVQSGVMSVRTQGDASAF